MGLIIKYLIIGLFVNLAYDLLVNTFDDEQQELRFTMFERLVIMFIWPYVLFNLIRHFIKNTFQ
jgi:Na+/H+-dicarboxylate symporter